ncbi:hypothetical protein [Trinickia violacea]|nr:hypothetical protein [Trinickia violacea]
MAVEPSLAANSSEWCLKLKAAVDTNTRVMVCAALNFEWKHA